MTSIQPIPFKRKEEPLPLLLEGNLFTRLLTARAIASFERRSTGAVIDERWPQDMLLKAASAPAMTSVTGWAAELVRRIVADALTALGPASSGAQVLQKGLVLTFDGAGQISAPGFVASAANASFVAEGAPIPVRQLSSAPALLSPFKLATIAVLTREMIESSNAEALISDALIKACGAALDAVLFGSAAASAAQPAGLRNGIATLTASASTDLFEAALEDIAAVINAVSVVGGAGPYALVMSAGRAIALGGRLYRDPNVNVYVSAAVGNDLVAIAPAAIVSALSPSPDTETANAGTLHMDTAPVADPGSTGTHKSLFQTETTAVKVRWPVSWVLRDTRGVAWLTPTWK